MAYIGQTYRINYISKGFTTGLTDVRMLVVKPDGTQLGIYNLIEFNGTGLAKGIYYYDFEDSDAPGVYLFIVWSVAQNKKDAKQVYFEYDRRWSDNERSQIRDALGINGTKVTAVNGQLQNLKISQDNLQSEITIIKDDIEFIKQIESGRWKINKSTSEMIFYKDDNTTEIMRFKLYNEFGQPNVEGPFERERL